VCVCACFAFAYVNNQHLWYYFIHQTVANEIYNILREQKVNVKACFVEMLLCSRDVHNEKHKQKLYASEFLWIIIVSFVVQLWFNCRSLVSVFCQLSFVRFIFTVLSVTTGKNEKSWLAKIRYVLFSEIKGVLGVSFVLFVRFFVEFLLHLSS
jgi:hypothetical protein